MDEQTTFAAAYVFFGSAREPMYRREGSVWPSVEEAESSDGGRRSNAVIAWHATPDELAPELPTSALADLVHRARFAAIYVPRYPGRPRSNYVRRGSIFLSPDEAEVSEEAGLPQAVMATSLDRQCLEAELPLPAIRELAGEVFPCGCESRRSCAHILEDTGRAPEASAPIPPDRTYPEYQMPGFPHVVSARPNCW